MAMVPATPLQQRIKSVLREISGGVHPYYRTYGGKRKLSQACIDEQPYLSYMSGELRKLPRGTPFEQRAPALTAAAARWRQMRTAQGYQVRRPQTERQKARRRQLGQIRRQRYLRAVGQLPTGSGAFVGGQYYGGVRLSPGCLNPYQEHVRSSWAQFHANHPGADLTQQQAREISRNIAESWTMSHYPELRGEYVEPPAFTGPPGAVIPYREPVAITMPQAQLIGIRRPAEQELGIETEEGETPLRGPLVKARRRRTLPKEKIL